MSDFIAPSDRGDHSLQISAREQLHSRGHAGERSGNSAVDVDCRDNSKAERKQHGPDHKIPGESVTSIRGVARVLGAPEFVGDDRIE